MSRNEHRTVGGLPGIRIGVSLQHGDHELLRDMSRAAGRSQSEFLAQLLRAEHERRKVSPHVAGCQCYTCTYVNAPTKRLETPLDPEERKRGWATSYPTISSPRPGRTLPEDE
jgi:hypothetical protein